MKWSGGDGSKKFHILIKDAKFQPLDTKTSESHELKLAMSNSLNYGKRCQVTVASIEDMSVNDCKHVLIGGDHVVSMLTLSKCNSNPRRSLVAEWVKPDSIPSEMKISLYHMVKNKRQEFRNTSISLNVTKHSFQLLMAATEYECEVELIYGNSEKTCCKSNKITTEKS